MRNYDHTWHTINFNALPKDDCLLSCLIILSRYYQHPRTAKSLSARLPLEQNKLTLELLPRAAARASLNTEFIECKWNEITPDMLPAIIITKDQKAHLLILNDEKKPQIISPCDTEIFHDPDTFEDKFSGQIVLIEPEYEFTERASESLKKENKNWFWPIFIKSWPIYSEVLVASLLINIFGIIMPLFVMNVYDRVVPNNAIETLWVLASGVFLVFFFDFVLKSLRSYFIDIASKRTDVDLSSSIFSHVMGISMRHRPKSIGSLANTVQSFEVFRDFITSSSVTVLVDIPFVFLYILVIYWIGGLLFLVPLIILPLILIVGLLIQIPMIRFTKKGYMLLAEKQAILFESLHNAEAIKTTGAESGLQKRWENIISLIAKNSSKLNNWSSYSSNFSVLMQQASTVTIIIVGVYLISEGNLTLGALIACSILNGRAIAPMTQIANILTRYYQSVNSLRGIDKVMNLETDVKNESNYLHRSELKGNIEFSNVSFLYNDEKSPILKDLNFKINAGEKVAIIGRIGSGKSSLARLLLRLYEPSKGIITIDGTDYRQINPDDLREQIGYVPQDVSLFYGTVKDNITIAAPFVEDKNFINACNISGVGNFTNKHPHGLDRMVGERGLELSGGQRQSVAISRALLLDPKIIVLDEPTSAMDDSSERTLKQNLKLMLTNQHTLILVTHKSSMLELVDRLIVFDEGKIVADGPKESVLSALKRGMNIKKGTK